MVEIKASENVDSEFTCHEKVEVASGYYKGYKGRVKNFDVKTSKYDVEIEVNERPIVISCKTDQLKHTKSFLGF